MSSTELITDSNTNINTIDNLVLLSINEVRKILRVRHSTVSDLINTGRLKAIKIKDRFKISKISLEEFINTSSSNDLRQPDTIHTSSSNLRQQINELINKNREQ